MMVEEASATVKMDENGRLYLPSQTRKALGIYDKIAQLDLDIKVLDVTEPEETEVSDGGD